MAELTPALFADLVTRLHREPTTNDALFGLPRRKWWQPASPSPFKGEGRGEGSSADRPLTTNHFSPDLSVLFHGHPAGNPLGPAAGPHTQMAQNLLLSYAAGSRIMELKTVQVNDRLQIGRPCIDIINVGYNIEWSQELLVEQSAREYVAGMMLIEMFRNMYLDTSEAGHTDLNKSEPGRPRPRSSNHAYILDLSVGYNLEGIRSPKIQHFLDDMRDATAIIAQLKTQIPADYAATRDLPYPAQISDSVTLSTFHGCPADEIERICEFLITQRDLHVIIKMNPPMLGKDHLEHLLHDVMGYTDLTVNPTAYTSGLQFNESLELCQRLSPLAASRNRNLGFKFSNTLEVINHRQFFPPGNDIMYLSGQPLHVITMALTDKFRRAVGPNVPISFSAGIDRQNAASVIACGIAPVTISTDLLRPGGYGRLADYFTAIYAAMKKVNATNIHDFILNYQSRDALQSRDREGAGTPPLGTTAHSPDAPHIATVPTNFSPPVSENCEPGTASSSLVTGHRALGTSPDLKTAMMLNTTHAAQAAAADIRYRAPANRKIPPRIDSHLVTFDCITCDKCIPVCPNAANFTYPTPVVSFDYHDYLIHTDGRIEQAQLRHFEIKEPMQIACYADFCNECGNCDTFCPEYGGPYIKKPTFYGSLQTYEQAAPRDGFVILDNGQTIRGRIKQIEYELFTLFPFKEMGRREGTLSPSPFKGEGRGEGVLSPSPFKGEGRGEGVLSPSPFKGEGRGEGSSSNPTPLFKTPTIECELNPETHIPQTTRERQPARPSPTANASTEPRPLELSIYHTLRILREGILDRRFVNQINAGLTPVARITE